MIKLIIGIICFYVLFSSYHIYKNIKTPIYDRSEELKYYKNKEINENTESKYTYKPYKNILKKNDIIDYHLYISCVKHIDLNKYINEKYIDSDKNFINVYNFTNTVYNWHENKIKKKKKWVFFTENIYPSFDLIIPDYLCKNKKNIYLHIITYVNNEIYRYGTITTVLTKSKKFNEKKKEKTYLWEWAFKEEKKDLNKNIKKRENSLYIPKRIQFGPVIEYNDFNINKLGFFSNIFISKSTNTYFLPIYINNNLTPEDEYTLLLNKTERDILNNDSNIKYTNKIEIEYVPISYTYFSLINIMMFNINYIKQKYSFCSYDLDSLTASICKNIHLSIFIYIICFIHLILDIIAIYFDKKIWENLNNLYFISSNNIHLKLIFTFFIFMYLKHKNEGKIIMLFLLLKILVCIWKLLDTCDIIIFTFYPFICINKRSILNKDNSNIVEFENNMKKKLHFIMIFSIIIIFIYNLVFNKYDSFYSLIITTSGVYSYIFNFIFMFPQVVKNYYTKTIQYIPLPSFVLLFLNAIMDDLLAIFLRVPTIHKFSVFGDDVIFTIFLLQYILYKKERKTKFTQKYKLEESKKRR
ncbi:serpentine receptor, putative [Plasmodium gallinaceum]|uniref:Serpentine receptor, putative n=1 Tax=Plasmodium gallinaceum TaxID=5849 RepID=A0A1J1GUY4_PLAGA|nr:serpentine receptor, putative [Plasmodium gallinaceum]CRG96361.1 serpentine receptor, putative [Plasmodium gallinaceum]